jgi:pimeloyl-ACP methyl ester carboxylesterase
MKLNYRIIGEGRPIVILHGLFGMSDNWLSFAKKLSEDAFQVVLVDLRNHGHSGQTTEHSYPLMASDVAELIADLQLANPVVMGHSMGGKVTLQLLIDKPDLVSKAIVVDIAPYQYPIQHREILDALLSVDLDAIKTRGDAEKILVQSIDDLGTRQFLLKNLYWIESDKLAWRFNLNAINATIENVGLPTWPTAFVTTPLLFIKGKKSGYIDESRMPEIQQKFPNATLAIIENAGHWVHADQPQKLLEVVLDFLG